jgi:DNA-directed RNA polymerase specialized sigma subunit
MSYSKEGIDIRELSDLIQLAQHGDKQAELELIQRFEPLINKYARQNGKMNEDCKQQLILEFILAIRRFDLSRYNN